MFFRVLSSKKEEPPVCDSSFCYLDLYFGALLQCTGIECELLSFDRCFLDGDFSGDLLASLLNITYSGNLTEDIAGLDFADDLPDDADSDSYLSVIMKYKCRILFTTRSRFEHYDTYELNEIRDTNELLSLADKFYNNFSADRVTALDIIETVHHHTFAVELAARLLQKGILSQKELLNKLKEENVRLSSADP